MVFINICMTLFDLFWCKRTYYLALLVKKKQKKQKNKKTSTYMFIKIHF